MKRSEHTDVLLVGAGPIGLELAVALGKAGIEYLHIDAGQIGQTIFDWPPLTRWFSSSERIEISGVPIQTISQEKTTREEYLAYLRSVVIQHDLRVQTYQRVEAIERNGTQFLLSTRSHTDIRQTYSGSKLILATGGTSRPAALNVEGAKLKHVHRHLGDPHRYFRRRLLIIGGKNSAVEAALRCYHVGANVTISYRGNEFPKGVKYWLRPEIEMLIDTGKIKCHFNTIPIAITPQSVLLKTIDGTHHIDVPVDFVLPMIGYIADMQLFSMAGITLLGERQIPYFNDQTMETNVPGVYVAGTATAGTQAKGYRLFLENCHIHVDRIVAALTGAPPPPVPELVRLPEA